MDTVNRRDLFSKVSEKDCEDPSFDYVVEIKEGARNCFGSTRERTTGLVGKGLAPHQMRVVPELHMGTYPGCYNTEKMTAGLYLLLHKMRSKAGVGALASKAPRFPKPSVSLVPPVGSYNLRQSWRRKQSFAPFNVTSKVGVRLINSYPGPGTYAIQNTWKCRRTRFMYNFGRPTMICCVETRCVPIAVDTCLKCNTLCKGDYWHKQHLLFLCHLCWNEEKANQEIFSVKALKQFKKIRSCSFMHNHEDTTAAIRIMPLSYVRKKIRLENYLDLYIKC